MGCCCFLRAFGWLLLQHDGNRQGVVFNTITDSQHRLVDTSHTAEVDSHPIGKETSCYEVQSTSRFCSLIKIPKAHYGCFEFNNL